jgi:hypothetical protein
VETRSSRWVEARVRAGAPVELAHRGSMSPTLEEGDRVTVVPFDSPPRAGEVVLHRRGALLVAHRLLRLDGDWAVTHGDALATADPPVARAALFGRVVAVHKRSRLWRWAARVKRLACR